MRSESVCVVGAGPSGITAAKNLLDAGFADLTVYDRGAAVGGNWVFDADSGHSSVFETTHIISSRAFSEYADFPFPDGTPDYPGHAALAAYFQAYAEHFRVTPHVRFRHTVLACVPTDSGWDVEVRDDVTGQASTRHFDKLVVANGHHWKPRWPEYPGEFAGEWVHSHDFKRATTYAGRRVLVIGGGNSACDVAVETSRVSARTDLSWRRGYWIVPKFLFGLPTDQLHQTTHRYLGWVPMRWRMKLNELLLRVFNGPNSAYGLPDPDHPFGSTHPTVNSELLYFLRHGAIHPRPDIARIEGHTVTFTDGTTGEYDAIIACTGFVIAHPFLDPGFVDYSEGPVPLYHRMIHPTRDDLVFIGLFQPLGCIWPCAELQSKLVARWWTGTWSPPSDRAAAIADQLARPHVAQLDSPRHTITVDEPMFRAELLAELGADVVSTEPRAWAGQMPPMQVPAARPPSLSLGTPPEGTGAPSVTNHSPSP